MTHIAPYIKEYARHFGANAAELLAQKYFVLTPNPAAGYNDSTPLKRKTILRPVRKSSPSQSELFRLSG